MTNTVVGHLGQWDLGNMNPPGPSLVVSRALQLGTGEIDEDPVLVV